MHVMGFALFVAKRLTTVVDGKLSPPGADSARVWAQPDGSSVSLISQGDAFDLYVGKKTIYNLTLTPRTAASMGWWLVRWWVFSQWFGIKLWLWHWCVGKIVTKTSEQKASTRLVGA